MEKEEWGEPELIVLVRSKPEEAVLETCKHSHHPHGHSPHFFNGYCNYSGCGECAGQVES